MTTNAVTHHGDKSLKRILYAMGRDSDLLRYGLLPGIGFLLTVWLWTSLSATTFEVGLTWFAVGFVYLLYLTRLFRQDMPDFDLREGCGVRPMC